MNAQRLMLVAVLLLAVPAISKDKPIRFLKPLPTAGQIYVADDAGKSLVSTVPTPAAAEVQDGVSVLVTLQVANNQTLGAVVAVLNNTTMPVLLATQHIALLDLDGQVLTQLGSVDVQNEVAGDYHPG